MEIAPQIEQTVMNPGLATLNQSHAVARSFPKKGNLFGFNYNPLPRGAYISSIALFSGCLKISYKRQHANILRNKLVLSVL